MDLSALVIAPEPFDAASVQSLVFAAKDELDRRYGPATDPTSLQLGGLPMLLGGESATVVGARIEQALKEDLGMNLRFVDNPGGR